MANLLLRDCISNWLRDCLLHGVTMGFCPWSSLLDNRSINFLDDASEPTHTRANLEHLEEDVHLYRLENCFLKDWSTRLSSILKTYLSTSRHWRAHPLDWPLARFSKNLISRTSEMPIDRIASVRSSSVVHCETKDSIVSIPGLIQNTNRTFGGSTQIWAVIAPHPCQVSYVQGNPFACVGVNHIGRGALPPFRAPRGGERVQVVAVFRSISVIGWGGYYVIVQIDLLMRGVLRFLS